MRGMAVGWAGALLLTMFACPRLEGQGSPAAGAGRRGSNAGSSSDYPVGLNGTGSGAASTSMARTVSGRVVNALTGAPVPRALVNLNSRAVLTDAQGKFNFAGFAEANAYAQVTKPGYSASAAPEANQMQRVLDLDAPLELKLYPDALLTGIVTGPDGLPLARTQVRLLRLSFDTTGARWPAAGTTQTDVHGNFRFDTSAGRYRVLSGYSARSVERGEAVLPAAFPPMGASGAGTLELSAGEQREIDLRPRVDPSYPVQIAVEGGDSGRQVRLTAAGPTGGSFQLSSQRSGDQLTAQLPAGTFTLRANSGDREVASAGEARITVTGHGIAQSTIHLAELPVFPLETSFEVVPVQNESSAVSTPSPQQFNLHLHNVASSEGTDPDVRMNVKPDRSASFQVPAGRYRLGGNQSGAWYIRSATLGVTDLLTEDLVVAGGAAGSPIRLIISDASGTLKGSMTTAGQPASGWVYLIPQQASLVPYVEIYVQLDGSYQWSGPPGRYMAVPSRQQVHEDFRDPAFLRRFSAGGREVEITSGAATSADLTLVPAGVAR